MRRSHVNVLLVVLLIILGSLTWIVSQWGHLFIDPMLAKGNAPVTFEIRPGTPLIAVAWELKRAGLIRDPERFVLLARIRGDLAKIKAGEYLIKPGKTTAKKFLDHIVAGKVVLRQLTIVEGWTFNQIMNAVNNNPYLQHTLTGLTDAAIMQKLGDPGVNPEGQFYPNTYLFNRGTSDVRILHMAYKSMQQLLQQQWAGRAPNLPYQNAYQALIAASMIERETSVPKERPEIAGVIVRRLQQRIRLEIDPTVIYAMGTAYQGKLTGKDLTINSPYNTYLHYGLPPSPIAVPSAASIYAALHPTSGNALYYVASGNGGHIFSATLRQHDAAIVRYLLRPKVCASPTLLLKFFSTCSS